MSLFDTFRAGGGEFLSDDTSFAQRAASVEAFLFDWDGVFNDGRKGVGMTSAFNEADSMGVNMLRFGYYLRTGRLPFTAIITGQHNESAAQLADRERFDAVFYRFGNKQQAADRMQQKFGVRISESAYFFDDIADLGLARHCALRLMIRRPHNHLMNLYVEHNRLYDYMTAATGGHFAVREACELILGVYDLFGQTLDERIAFSDSYQNYLEKRRKIKTVMISPDT